MDGSALPPIPARPSAAEGAYQALRRAIVALELLPGARLSRQELATSLGVSQTPVREALIRLGEEGLVEVVPQSATRVARIDLHQCREAAFLRMAVECAVVRRLAEKADPGLPARLEGDLARMRGEFLADDMAGFSAGDETFHALLHEAAGVGGLRALVASRSGHLDRLRRLHLPEQGKPEAILAEHGAVIAAIAAGDTAAAEAAMRRHLSGSLAEAPRLQARFPGYFSN
ncbi:GntR family transcriptional regulator [Rhodovarius lipocyclicus]|uniref:GntR family transcriptional regulator n=1 Tax=Rhodovarius lipocyclicus TaxID=268410 RepID=UPI00135947D4|nr:GntR family transcriptional regulator [Rhodovarius lipocyclicus]